MWGTGDPSNRCLSGQSAFMLLNIYICHLFFSPGFPPFGLLSKPVSIFNRGFLQKQSTSWRNPFLNEVYKLLCKDWHFCGFYRTVAADRAHGGNLLRSTSPSPSEQRWRKGTFRSLLQFAQHPVAFWSVSHLYPHVSDETVLTVASVKQSFQP